MPWVAICQRVRPACGFDRLSTFVRVIDSIREIEFDVATFVSEHGDHPWADSGNNEYVVDITAQQAADILSGANPLSHDGFANEPRWQNQNEGSGTAYVPGSYSTRGEAGSAFTADVPLIDDRLVARAFDGDPSAAGVHFAFMECGEGDNAGEIDVYCKLSSYADTPLGITESRKIEVLGKPMILDFVNDVAVVILKTAVAGKLVIPSSFDFRWVGPAGEKQVVISIYGRTLSASKD